MQQADFTILTNTKLAHLASSEAVVGFRSDGLFARVNCFLNTIRLAEKLDKPARFLWKGVEPMGGGTAHGYDSDWRSILLDDRIVGVSSTIESGSVDANMRTWTPAVLPGEDVATVRAELGQIARSLTMVDGRTVGEAASTNLYTWCLHARQDDAAQLKWMLTKYFPASGWLQVLETLMAQDPNGNGFLASDSHTLKEMARARYGHSLRTPEEVIPEGLGKLQADFAEAIHLSKGRRLIAPRASAFSLFASLVGGVTVESPEHVLGITDIVEDIVWVALASYERDLGRAIEHIDHPGEPQLAGLRRSLDEVRTLMQGKKRSIRNK